MNTSTYKSDFAHVNGVHLHYLDWGGDDDMLLFLPGLGNTG
jgi:pimeloyl-ACP methyl ester carboxylesterase